MRRFEAKMLKVAGAKAENCEAMSFLRYEKGQAFSEHHDQNAKIGLGKAVGARWLDIMAQFLIESVLLSLGGGLVGIGVGWLVMQVGGQLVQDIQLLMTPDVVLLATGVSSMIGIFFGLYPANRAASMRPIDALRYE